MTSKPAPPRQLVGNLVVWQHPMRPSRTYHERVVRIGPRFIEVKDSVATEGILPEWIIHTRHRSTVRPGCYLPFEDTKAGAE